MSDPSNDDGAPTTSSVRRLQYAVAALAAVSLVLLVALIVSRDGDDDAEPAASSESTVATITTPTTPDTTDPPTTTSTTTPDATSTTIAQTTTTTTTTTTTITAATVPTLPTTPTGSTWTAVAAAAGELEFTMEVADRAGELVAYDGEADDGVSTIRCVAVTVEGEPGWREWCGGAGQASRFVIVHDDVPWLVEVGPRRGEVALLVQPASWTLPSNGCTVPMAPIVSAALRTDEGALPTGITWVRCVGDEAFVSFGSVLLQPGPADGGGTLVVRDGDSWTSLGRGTEVDCADPGDGVDRCAAFGAEFSLFEALLPIASPDTTGPTDAVTGLVDRTAEVESWIAGVTDPTELETDVIDSVVVDRLFDPDAEVPASVRRADRLGFGGVNLLVVQIPQLDDAVATETWAVWIGALEETAGVHLAVSWATCARGVTDDGLCV